MGKGGFSKGRKGGKGKSKGGIVKKGGVQYKLVYMPNKQVKGKGKSGGKKGGGFKGRSFGKSKGKGKRAASLSSRFWEKKVENEQREEIGQKMYNGVIASYNVRKGFGFIKPDNLGVLPGNVKSKIKQSEKAATAEGKELQGRGLLYFRKPDVNHTDGFFLTSDAPVKFKLYVDDLGAGACDVSMRGAAPSAPNKASALKASFNKWGGKGAKKGGGKASVVKTAFNKPGKGKSKGKGKGKGEASGGKVDDSLKVWVGNVAEGATAEALKELFNTAGPTAFAKLMKKGTAVVAFKNAKGVAAAIESFNGVDFEGQALEVDVWQKKSD